MKWFILIVCSLQPIGCTSTQQPPQHINSVSVELEHCVTIEDGHQNSMSIDSFWERVNQADVVILGELHDHVVGHAFQEIVVRYVMESFPKSTLALEMLERDEQSIIDDFLDDIVDGEKLATLTHSQNWAGKGSWVAWYQPILNTTKELGGSIIGANAPRRYVTLARTEGFDAIKALPPYRRSLVSIPEPLVDNHYQDRFFELAGITEHDERCEESDRVFGFYRAQQVWDATMADSVAQLNPTVDAKVLLLVGQFHVEYDGGLIQLLKRDLPNANVLVITVHRSSPDLEFEDIPISDVIVYEN